MNGFFVSAEFAMVKIRNSRIETLIQEGNKKALLARKITSDLNSYLSACQLGITLASLGIGWIGEPAFAKLLQPIFSYFAMPAVAVHSISFILGFTIITGMHIVLGELAPKSLAIFDAEKVIMKVALPMIIFYKLTYPIIWIFNKSSAITLKIIGIENMSEHEEAHTDEEIKILVEESYKHGLIDQTELTFVDNIFDFSETTVKDIMIPRTDMICIYKEDTFDEIIKYSLEEQMTRYPYCNESKDNVLGYIHIKDLYKLKLEGKENNFDSIIRKILTVPEIVSVSVLLKEFQKSKEQMAIVVDEYGGTSGLVTLEDIIEEIVGEIQDEFDEDNQEIKTFNETTFSISGRMPIDEVNEKLSLDIKVEDIDTIAGWFCSKIDGIPKIGQIIIYKNFQFKIIKMDNRKIIRILAHNMNKRD
jgi:CBS domain containing-hemolysin-like protein